MQKIYSRTYWENFPSEKTAIDAMRLNNAEAGIDNLDDRVVAMDASKVDLAKANELVKEILWDESKGTITVVKMNGSKAVIDTKLEKLAVNFTYDPQSQQLIITLDDGTTQNVDLSALITEYEFLDSDTIAFEITDGKIKAIVKNGSITEDMLQPNFLADVKVEAEKAKASASAADASEKESTVQANLSKEYADKAKEYSDNIDKKAHLATFDVNEDGELIYTDNTADVFTVDNDGNLNWEVA
jgi:hypothetical protein|nr:MAG TPA: hypothetical protein [Caudoviricetes sp.]